jgi:predicted thioesterase
MVDAQVWNPHHVASAEGGTVVYVGIQVNPLDRRVVDTRLTVGQLYHFKNKLASG